jgi:subtilase family protein
MGQRTAFRNWDINLRQWSGDDGVSQAFTTIEDVHAPSVDEKIKGDLPASGEVVFEIVLHTHQLVGEHHTLPAFKKYLRELDLNATFERRLYAGGLCFVDIDAPVELAEKIALFTPVRALRQMPRLRMMRPTFRSGGYATSPIVLPTEGPLDPDLKVAIFDGGLPDNHPVTAWAKPIDTTGGPPIEEATDHGASVISAFLFGNIDPAKPLPRPYAGVVHYRVFDADTQPGQDPHELAIVLERIDKILSRNHYDLVNFSIGPEVPIEDDDIHPWTAVIDERPSAGKTLATFAVGNGGMRAFSRVQVPSDCINGLAVGACDSPDKSWARAPYSSIGPGRSPGVIKPDLGVNGTFQTMREGMSHADSQGQS